MQGPLPMCFPQENAKRAFSEGCDWEAVLERGVQRCCLPRVQAIRGPTWAPSQCTGRAERPRGDSQQLPADPASVSKDTNIVP